MDRSIEKKTLLYIKSVGFGLIIFILAFVNIFPIFWAFSTSLKNNNEIMTIPPSLIPDNPTLENYERLLDEDILMYTKNSLFTSFGSLAIVLLFGSLAAYGFARFKFKGKGVFLLIIIAGMTLPLASLVIPLFFIFSKLGMADKWYTLIIIYTALNLPFCIWALKGYIETIPPSLDKAAMVDGYSRVQALRKVIIPIAAPSFLTVAIFSLIGSWNDYVLAATLTSNPQIRTLAVQMRYYLGVWGREWGPLTGAAVFSTVPVIIVFIFFRHRLISGLTSGAVKG